MLDPFSLLAIYGSIWASKNLGSLSPPAPQCRVCGTSHGVERVTNCCEKPVCERCISQNRKPCRCR
jgi:hypothetical protein